MQLRRIQQWRQFGLLPIRKTVLPDLLW